MRPGIKASLVAVFALTGFSALTLQVVWQRIISMHAGVDLASFTTVIAAFLAGLGVGSLVGGWLADRLGPRRSLVAFAASNLGIAAFAVVSVWVFYDLYRSLVENVSGPFASFAFNFALLILPTTLMGLSLPLVSRGIVDRIQDAAPMVGRLYAVNTIGAGVGAAVSGWLLLGNLGFVGTVRLAGGLNLLAAALIVSLWRVARRVEEEVVPRDLVAAGGPGAAGPTGEASPERSAVPWLVIYGLTGAVALGLELVFFRIVDGLMRSNSYTFGHVLMLYLLLFGGGAALASKLVKRTERPERWFLGLQFGVGLAALAGVLVLVEVPSLLGVEGPLRRHFAIDGYNVGGYRFWPATELARLAFVHVFGPLLVMGLPVLLMGAAFPFAQALVARRMDTLGRQTGRLLFANITGNVVGTLVVGFVLMDRLGTSGTLRLLAALLLVPGLAAAAVAGGRARTVGLGAGAVALMTGALAVFPSNHELWSFLHSAQDKSFTLVEERACVNALRRDGDEELLFINAASQNAYPYDDFHVLIGLMPAIVHPDPSLAAAVGLGIGATPYGMALDSRLERVEVVELCGGEIELLRILASRGSPENQRLFADERVDLQVGDGRKFLLASPDRFNVVTVDAIRPTSGFSGSLYSVEFYELVRSRLAPGGLFAQWIPTIRTLNSVMEVFPHVLGFTVESYYSSQFVIASMEPIPFDREAAVGRLDRILGAPGVYTLPPERMASIRSFVAGAQPAVIRDGTPLRPADPALLNRDLFPRDEYFLNNPRDVPIRPTGSS